MSPAHPLPAGCDVRIVGAAPGATVDALKIFARREHRRRARASSRRSTTPSPHGVNVINESFGGNGFPDTATDIVRAADEAAVAAGVTVVVSSGDAGHHVARSARPRPTPTSSPSARRRRSAPTSRTPSGGSTSPVSTTATSTTTSRRSPRAASPRTARPSTSWRPATSTGRCARRAEHLRGLQRRADPAVGGHERVRPADRGRGGRRDRGLPRLAPRGEPDARARHADPHELGDGHRRTRRPAGRGAARRRCGGAPRPVRAGHDALARGPAGCSRARRSSTSRARPRRRCSQSVSLTNTSDRTASVDASRRAALVPRQVTSGAIALNPSVRPHPTRRSPSGPAPRRSTGRVAFHVGRGVGRIQLQAAYQFTGQSSLLHVALFTPSGELAGYSNPQGIGDYADVEVAPPAAGTWTAGVLHGLRRLPRRHGTSGRVPFTFTELAASCRVGTVTPAAHVSPPGASRRVQFNDTLPADAG